MSVVSASPALLREAENFTLFIKNSISFPRFKVTRFVEKQGETQAALGGHNLSPLSPCTHADFLLGQKLGWAPVCGVGGAAFSSKGCGRGVSGAWEGGAPRAPGPGGYPPMSTRHQCLLAHTGATWWRRWTPAT